MTTPLPGTADLCDAHADRLAVAAPILRSFGGRRRFRGAIATLRCFEDNSLVRERLGETGQGRVLVIDGGGSLKCALVGDQLGALGVKNGWSGVIVFGCVRDTAALGAMDLGVLALAPHPLKSVKRGAGERDVTVAFAGVSFTPGAWVCADEDGVVVAATPL
jgi:regulator of ribonuclease activity A